MQTSQVKLYILDFFFIFFGYYLGTLKTFLFGNAFSQKVTFVDSKQTNQAWIDQNFIQGQTKSGQFEYWLVKKPVSCNKKVEKRN